MSKVNNYVISFSKFRNTFMHAAMNDFESVPYINDVVGRPTPILFKLGIRMPGGGTDKVINSQ